MTTPAASSEPMSALLDPSSLGEDDEADDDDAAEARAYSLSGSSGCRFMLVGGRLDSSSSSLTGEDDADETSILGAERTSGE